MLKTGHARLRLLAAMIAAIGLHALFFFLIPSQNSRLLLTPEGDLQVELLAQKQTFRPAKPQHVSATPRTTKEHVKPEPLPQKQYASHRHQQPVVIQPRTIANQLSNEINRQIIEPDEPTSATSSNTLPLADVKNSNEESATTSNGVTAIPRNIHKTILAQVHYPKWARRHGWQGSAEFQFNVQQQTIQNITMLASTGHPILDRAAMRGLTSVNQIPLSNGLYRMPVMFRLQ